MASYIPTRDVDLAPWLTNFSTLITAAPATYGLQPSDATAISTVVDAYEAAYTISSNPSTRTPATIAAKDSAKGAALPIVRLYAQTIKLNQGVSNENKIALGIHINDAGPSPVPVPTSLPLLTITGARHLFQEIKIQATETPTSKAKPAGVLGALIFTTVGTTVATDPDVSPFKALNTKTPTQLEFTSDQVGKIATTWARWYNRKGQLGPWSLPISQTIA